MGTGGKTAYMAVLIPANVLWRKMLISESSGERHTEVWLSLQVCKNNFWPGMVAYAFNPITREAETSGSLHSSLAWSMPAMAT